MSVQAQILNTLIDLQEKLGLTYLFVAHDLRVVAHVSDRRHGLVGDEKLGLERVAVMFAGKIVEQKARDDLFRGPEHELTRTRLASIP